MHVSSQCVLLKFMLCSLCGTFQGSPCDVCRTHSRIGFLIQTGRLQQRDEKLLLSGLRNLAGLVSDLVERGAKDKYGALSTDTVEGKETTEGEHKEEEKEKSPEVGQSEPSKKEKHKKRKKDKKEKKERLGSTSSKVPHPKEDESPEEAPEDREAERTEEAVKTEEKSEEAEEEEVKRLAEEVTAAAEKYPNQLGLVDSPFKRKNEEAREGKSKRPVFTGSGVPEPAIPPRHRHHDEIIPRRPQGRERSRTPKKRRRGTKGAGHRERGRSFKKNNWRYYTGR